MQSAESTIDRKAALAQTSPLESIALPVGSIILDFVRTPSLRPPVALSVTFLAAFTATSTVGVSSTASVIGVSGGRPGAPLNGSRKALGVSDGVIKSYTP